MAGGSCSSLAELPAALRALLDDARRAVLATVSADGTPMLVPVCYAVRGGEIVTAVDDKPKSSARLARIGNIERDARVSFLVDRWDEDWSRLAWVRVEGIARIEPPGTADAVLASRYAQYLRRPPGGPVVAVAPVSVRWWAFAQPNP